MKTKWDAKNLKVGDTVAIRSGSVYNSVQASKVIRISPTGQITLKNGLRFTKDGRLMGTSSLWGSCLEQFTDKVAVEIEKACLMRQVEILSGNYRTFSNKDLKRLILFLESPERKKNAEMEMGSD